jgi:hypothetical protein
MITENELRSSDLGARDPTAVALVFGEDFASQFCAPFETIRSPISTSPPKDGNLFSIEATKFIAPRDFPNIIVEESSNIHPESNKNYTWASEPRVSESVQKHLHYFDYSTNDSNTDCAKENPEFLGFQRSFIRWVSRLF